MLWPLPRREVGTAPSERVEQGGGPREEGVPLADGAGEDLQGQSTQQGLGSSRLWGRPVDPPGLLCSH